MTESSHALRFQVLILPNLEWAPLLARFERAEELGFDLAVTADHLVDWTDPPSPWFELWTLLAGVSQRTSRIRLAPCVGQIPLRNPAMFAREALTVDHLSNGRLEVGLGLGLPIDPSYDMAGLPNWSNKERAARFREYVEIVDSLLSNEVTSYDGEYYRIEGAYMNPRPVQSPRPPITIAAMGPRMVKYAATYADTWNTMSFADDFDAQISECEERVGRVREHLDALGRPRDALRLSYNMFDPGARRSGGRFVYYESPERFREMATRLIELGFRELGVYYPMVQEQVPVFEAVAREIMPALRAEFAARR